MSGKRSLPSPWASRGAIFAALTGVGMVLFAVVGAWMLFAPSGDEPTTTRDEPSAETTTTAPGDKAIEDEPTMESSAPRKPRTHVETVPPSPAPTPTAHPPAEEETSTPDPASPGSQEPAPGDDHPGNGHGNGNGNGNGNGPKA